MKIVVPLTSHQERRDGYPWCVAIKPNQRNGLGKKSTADAAQIKCVSIERFVKRIGVVSSAALDGVLQSIQESLLIHPRNLTSDGPLLYNWTIMKFAVRRYE